ncbi:hypothetical protein [Flavobacterium sp.]|uniref:hypothetical protein n=1 Tax=Flavobacterium sp. TaxID=239 RepID=UPI004033A41D
MPSTQDHATLPSPDKLRSICKAISVLDAILSPEWQFRYYSYSSKWGDGEECLQMRNGQGDEMHILFTATGCAINGFVHEYPQPDKEQVTKGLPAQFDEFIFGEPVNSIGTTFCLWNEGNVWQAGSIENFDDNSVEMLSIFDYEPQSYINYASDYFETELPLPTVASIYSGETLTKEMVLSIVEDLADWDVLKKDLIEIDYPFDLPDNPKKSKWKLW